MYKSLSENGLTLAEIIAETHGEPHNIKNDKTAVHSICTDTRKSVFGSLFIPLSGENFNGRDFIGESFKKGAVSALTEEKLSTDKPYILVKNTTAAYGNIASLYRKKFDVKMIAVTGSVGKTTTKEAVCAVLGAKYAVCKTKANHNNEIGLPETLLGLNSCHNAAVVEMGMAASGEISYLSKIALPDISVITNIGTSHIEYLGSRENILAAKLEITDGMNDGGTLLVNGDDDMLKSVRGTRQKRLNVGIDDKTSDFRAQNVRLGDSGVIFDLCFDGKTEKDLFFPSLGRHSVYAALFAAASGILCGLGEEEIRSGLLSYEPVDLRQKITRKNGVVKIEDCYNASPESMRASIDILKYLNSSRGGRAIAVLGEMKELGGYSLSLHEDVGRYAAENADALFLFGEGENVSAMARGYSSKGKDAVLLGNDIGDAREILKRNLRGGDTVLFKASRAVKLERLSENL